MQSSSGFSWYNGLVAKKTGQSLCIIFPGNASLLKEIVFNEFHTSPLGGQLVYHKLLTLVNACVWWLHMSSAVQEFCRLCVLCLLTKVATLKPLGLLLLIEPPFKLFELVARDLITHIPVSSKFDAVFTIVDKFSKYGKFLPCSTSSTVVDLALLFHDNIVCKFGMLVKIISDRDSKFLSKFWQS